MDHLVDELQRSVERWDELGWPRPEVMVVSGSGLATSLGRRVAGPLPWTELLPFPASGIEGHALEVEVLETDAGRTILYSRGRLHAYQGFTAAQVVFTVRLAALLGVQVLVLTNSSGGLQPTQHPGDLVVIRDHINLSGLTPLLGPFPEAWGPQFPDMAAAYDPALRALLWAGGKALGIDLGEGVYVGLLGPTYETPAEVRMLRTLGGDMVGMSTVLETIAGHHMGMRCVGLSMISNPGAGITDEVLVHADVLERAKAAAGKIGSLLGWLVAHPDLMKAPGPG